MPSGKLKPFLSLAVFLCLWEAIARIGVVPQYIFPPFSSVILSLYKLIASGVLVKNYALTLARSFMGFALGTTAGLAIGFLPSLASKEEGIGYIQPIATLLFSIPSVGWIPLLMVWVGLRQFKLPVAVSFMCSFPPVFYGVLNSIRTMDKDQIGVALSLGASPSYVFRRIVVPQVLLNLMPILKSEAVMVWKSVFVTEMVALSSGLGYLALMYSSTIEVSNLLAVLLVLSLTTIVIIQLFDSIESRVAGKWTRK